MPTNAIIAGNCHLWPTCDIILRARLEILVENTTMMSLTVLLWNVYDDFMLQEPKEAVVLC